MDEQWDADVPDRESDEVTSFPVPEGGALQPSQAELERQVEERMQAMAAALASEDAPAQAQAAVSEVDVTRLLSDETQLIRNNAPRYDDDAAALMGLASREAASASFAPAASAVPGADPAVVDAPAAVAPAEPDIPVPGAPVPAGLEESDVRAPQGAVPAAAAPAEPEIPVPVVPGAPIPVFHEEAPASPTEEPASAYELEQPLDAGDTQLDVPSSSDPSVTSSDLSTAPSPGVIPVSATALRPRIEEDPDRYLRRTRDYDHDAQSVNTVASADRFETISEKRSWWDTHRDPYARSARKGTAPGEGNSRSKLRPLLALLLVVAVIAGGGSVLAYGMELWGGKTVPAVVGQSQANAELALNDKGFVVRVEAEPADDAIGKVLSQDPVVGTRVPEGSEVTIVVAANRTMPDVVGLTESEARRALANAGAESIESVEVSSSAAEGTVIAVSPAAGEAFLSRSTVVLSIAAPFRVPNVIDKKEADAVNELKAAGFTPEVSYVTSEKTVRTVVETVPAAGEVIAEGGTVQVKVASPYPTNPLHLVEFFSHSSQDIDDYLQKQGFAFEQGFVDSYGNALQLYTSGENGTMTFSSQPYLSSLSFPKEGSSNVMATGTPFAGVRFDFPAHQVPGDLARADLEGLAALCGFEGMTELCNSQSMSLPAGVARSSTPFACAGGTSGDLAWTVLIVASGNGKRAFATCAKNSLYNAADLAPFGGSISQFVAYQEVYQPSINQAKQGQKKEGSAGGQAQQSDKHGA